MVNNDFLAAKIATFFNSLNPEEVAALRKFTMTKKWTSFIETRIYNKKIEI